MLPIAQGSAPGQLSLPLLFKACSQPNANLTWIARRPLMLTKRGSCPGMTLVLRQPMQGNQSVVLQVDITWIRAIHRTGGSAVGALFGYLVMLRPEVADNPYALTALLCFWCFLCGLANFTSIRYGSFLACYTASIVVLVSDCWHGH